MNQIRSISPVSDADAARLVSRDALADLAGQIVATPVLDKPARWAASSVSPFRPRFEFEEDSTSSTIKDCAGCAATSSRRILRTGPGTGPCARHPGG